MDSDRDDDVGDDDGLGMELPNLETKDDVDHEKNMVEMSKEAQ
jgi:hypothetical protein